MLVKEIVEGKDPEADPRRRDQLVDPTEWRGGCYRERKGPNTHRANQRIALCPGVQRVGNARAQVDIAIPLRGIERVDKATASGQASGHWSRLVFNRSGHEKLQRNGALDLP
jgi:hypothetical protein